jgi:hypothetical protein
MRGRDHDQVDRIQSTTVAATGHHPPPGAGDVLTLGDVMQGAIGANTAAAVVVIAEVAPQQQQIAKHQTLLRSRISIALRRKSRREPRRNGGSTTQSDQTHDQAAEQGHRWIPLRGRAVAGSSNFSARRQHRA